MLIVLIYFTSKSLWKQTVGAITEAATLHPPLIATASRVVRPGSSVWVPVAPVGSTHWLGRALAPTSSTRLVCAAPALLEAHGIGVTGGQLFVTKSARVCIVNTDQTRSHTVTPGDIVASLVQLA